MAKARKEIDKEAMFNKIMPSVVRPIPDGTESPDVPVDGQPEDSFGQAPAKGIGAKKSVIDPRHEVLLSEPEPTALVNLMERMVADKLDAAIDKFRCCKCDKCKKDVAAIALNKLKPRYVVVDKLAALAEERLTSTEVTTALIQAILIVKAHPRH